MKTSTLLTTLTTMTFALACAALMVVGDAASACAPSHAAPRCAAFQ